MTSANVLVPLRNSKITVDLEFQALVPPLQPAELAQLETNLVADGCRDPLVFWAEEGILLDGHHRYEICTRLGLPYATVEQSCASRDAALLWLVLNQFGRRNLTPFQRIELALVAEPLIASEARERQREAGRDKLRQDSAQARDERKTAAKLGQLAGVSRDTIAKAKVIAEQATEEVKEKLRKGETTINAEHKKLIRQQTAKALEQRVSLPDAKYRVISADPPWSYNDKADAGSVQSGGAAHHYPTMSIQKLCDLPVQDICEPDAVLFLWVTSPLLEDAFAVIKAWAFTYRASFVWDKVKHNMGHYNSVRHEFLLVCGRGSCAPKKPTLYDSVQVIERTGHSEKPERFREIIDEIYPTGRRIELFARKQPPAPWEGWGNELL